MESEESLERTEIDRHRWDAAVDDRVAAPASREPDVLPFAQRSPSDFEKILLVIGEQVDGLRGVRIYGVPGQAQFGIDLYGSSPNQENTAYQAKRYAEFDENDLEAAVTKFASNKQKPVNAKRFVVCVSAVADRRQVSDKLEELRTKYRDKFELDLYDGRRLSELLKSRPDLVRRLFGPEWAAAFCDGVEWPVPDLSPSDVVADALVRGPIETLGLTRELERANELAEGSPREAAEMLGHIVSRLRESGFTGFVRRLRAQRAELLVAAGELADGVSEYSELAWEEIEGGATHWDRHPLGRISALMKDAPDECVNAFIAITRAIDSWYGSPAFSLSSAAEYLRAMHRCGHELTGRVSSWLLEATIADRDDAASAALAPVVASCVAGRAGLSLADELTVRMRTALADVTSDWEDLLRDARSGRLGSRGGTLVHARAGRHAFRQERPVDADAEFSATVQQACTSGLFGEASTATRSVATVRLRFGGLADVNSLLQLAADVERSNDTQYFNERDHLLDARTALLSERLPSALRSFRSALRSATVRGDINGETDALLGVADVLKRSGEPAAALRYALEAGSVEYVEALAPTVGYVADLSSRVGTGPYWQRAAALRCISLQADLVPDDDVKDLATRVLSATQEPARGHFAPHVHLNAWKAAAALVERMSLDAVEEALTLLEPMIGRQPNHYRFEDDDHVAAVVGALRGHPSLRGRCAAHLASIIEQGDNFADTARSRLLRSVETVPEELIERCKAMADGNSVALDLLRAAGEPHPQVVDSARAAVENLLSTPAPAQGVMHFGLGYSRIAVRARVLTDAEQQALAEHFMSIARAVDRPESNRSEAIEGVAILANVLPSEIAEDYFEISLGYAGGTVESEVDPEMRSGTHPLNTFRFDLDFGSLPREAIEAAAALARSQGQVDRLAKLAIAWLYREDEKDVYAASRALAHLHGKAEIDFGLLAQHPRVWVRQVAASSAVLAADEAVLRDLVRDPVASIRTIVSTGLESIAAQNHNLAVELAAILYSDHRWSVRNPAENFISSNSAVTASQSRPA